MMQQFECNEVGALKEYIGCKIHYNKQDGFLKITRTVLMQSYMDEFGLKDDEPCPQTPAITGDVLMKINDSIFVSRESQQIYQSGVGKYSQHHDKVDKTGSVECCVQIELVYEWCYEGA